MGVVCKYCDKNFTLQSNLNRHVKNVHGENEKNIISYEFNVHINKCLEGCRVSFVNITQLRMHLTQIHGINFVEQTFAFKNFEEFDQWLQELSNSGNVRYFKQKTMKNDEMETTYFYCNQSGKCKRIPENDRQRKLKSQGTCKLGIACTSTIQLKKISTRHIVKYVSLHYGHDAELQHIRLLPSDRAVVAEKLAKGVPVARILDSTRQSIEAGSLKRSDLLTKMDICNVKNAFNINISEGVRHTIDSISVELWIEEYRQDSFNTVFYKKQGETNSFFQKDDMCLIFMNSPQEFMLKTFGDGGIICVDSTHGLNGYNFELTTILVVDEFGEGFPAATMFTNRKDSLVFKFFFDIIKEKAGVNVAKTFMTDITLVFYNAWVTSMEPVLYQIFCSWHIDHAWRANLNKISDKEKRQSVYHALKVVQTEIDEGKFVDELSKFVEMLNGDEDTFNFGKYFVDNYANNYRQWAYAFRKSAGINTNMHLESMHKCIKYFHLDGRIVKRLDKGIHAVNTYIRDKVIDCMIKQVRGKNTTHISKIEKRHATALKSIFSTEKVEEATFSVTNEGSTYMVSKNESQNTICCQLKCSSCNICIHTYRCTCIDFFIKATICKHIHYVVSVENSKEQKIPEDTSNNMVCVSSECSSSNEVKVHLNTVAKKIKPIRDLLKEKCLDILKLNLENVDDSVIQHALKACTSAHNLLRTGSAHTNKTVNQPTTDHVYEPANKRIKKQLTFYSTKKKKSSRLNIMKPNRQETADMKSAHLSGIYFQRY